MTKNLCERFNVCLAIRMVPTNRFEKETCFQQKHKFSKQEVSRSMPIWEDCARKDGEFDWDTSKPPGPSLCRANAPFSRINEQREYSSGKTFQSLGAAPEYISYPLPDEHTVPCSVDHEVQGPSSRNHSQSLDSRHTTPDTSPAMCTTPTCSYKETVVAGNSHHQTMCGDVGKEGGTCPEGGEWTCAVCGDRANGNYFGATTCLSCKSFFIRCTKDGEPALQRLCQGNCDVSKHLRNRCRYCRFQQCVAVGMSRKEKPEVVLVGEGQELCRVCADLANGVHFGVLTCEGCKKFFRRGLKEYQTYVCKSSRACPLNPRSRNSCRFCRYNKCLQAGMSRTAIKIGRPRKTLNFAKIQTAEEKVPTIAVSRDGSGCNVYRENAIPGRQNESGPVGLPYHDPFPAEVQFDNYKNQNEISAFNTSLEICVSSKQSVHTKWTPPLSRSSGNNESHVKTFETAGYESETQTACTPVSVFQSQTQPCQDPALSAAHADRLILRQVCFNENLCQVQQGRCSYIRNADVSLEDRSQIHNDPRFSLGGTVLPLGNDTGTGRGLCHPPPSLATQQTRKTCGICDSFPPYISQTFSHTNTDHSLVSNCMFSDGAEHNRSENSSRYECGPCGPTAVATTVSYTNAEEAASTRQFHHLHPKTLDVCSKLLTDESQDPSSVSNYSDERIKQFSDDSGSDLSYVMTSSSPIAANCELLCNVRYQQSASLTQGCENASCSLCAGYFEIFYNQSFESQQRVSRQTDPCLKCSHCHVFDSSPKSFYQPLSLSTPAAAIQSAMESLVQAEDDYVIADTDRDNNVALDDITTDTDRDNVAVDYVTTDTDRDNNVAVDYVTTDTDRDNVAVDYVTTDTDRDNNIALDLSVNGRHWSTFSQKRRLIIQRDDHKDAVEDDRVYDLSLKKRRRLLEPLRTMYGVPTSSH